MRAVRTIDDDDVVCYPKSEVVEARNGPWAGYIKRIEDNRPVIEDHKGKLDKERTRKGIEIERPVIADAI